MFIDVLQLPSLKYQGEQGIVAEVLQWINLNPEYTEEQQKDLLTHINIKKLDEQELLLTIRKCKTLRTSTSLNNFRVECMDSLSSKYLPFERSTPIPRLQPSRGWQMFSVTLGSILCPRKWSTQTINDFRNGQQYSFRLHLHRHKHEILS